MNKMQNKVTAQGTLLEGQQHKHIQKKKTYTNAVPCSSLVECIGEVVVTD